MTLLVILIAINLGAWCWLAGKALTTPDTDPIPVDRPRHRTRSH